MVFLLMASRVSLDSVLTYQNIRRNAAIGVPGEVDGVLVHRERRDDRGAQVDLPCRHLAVVVAHRTVEERLNLGLRFRERLVLEAHGDDERVQPAGGFARIHASRRPLPPRRAESRGQKPRAQRLARRDLFFVERRERPEPNLRGRHAAQKVLADVPARFGVDVDVAQASVLSARDGVAVEVAHPAEKLIAVQPHEVARPLVVGDFDGRRLHGHGARWLGDGEGGEKEREREEGASIHGDWAREEGRASSGGSGWRRGAKKPAPVGGTGAGEGGASDVLRDGHSGSGQLGRPWQRLNFLPLPQGQGAFGSALSGRAARSWASEGALWRAV